MSTRWRSRRNGAVRGLPMRLTTGLNARSISITGDARRVAYSLYIGHANIYSLPIPASGVALSTDATPVTSGPQIIEAVMVSDDGKWVLYDSDHDGVASIYRVPTSGGEPEQLTNECVRYLRAQSLAGRQAARVSLVPNGHARRGGEAARWRTGGAGHLFTGAGELSHVVAGREAAQLRRSGSDVPRLHGHATCSGKVVGTAPPVFRRNAVHVDDGVRHVVAGWQVDRVREWP